jgi:hypothetical protein
MREKVESKMKLLPDKPDLRENGRCEAKTIEDMGDCVNYQKSEGVRSAMCKHIVACSNNGGACRVDQAVKEVIGE